MTEAGLLRIALSAEPDVAAAHRLARRPKRLVEIWTTGRRSASASMITTGSPSAKLGSTSARAARSSFRTRFASTQPVMRIRDSSL